MTPERQDLVKQTSAGNRILDSGLKIFTGVVIGVAVAAIGVLIIIRANDFYRLPIRGSSLVSRRRV